jgi:hypothetical protein
MAGYFGAACRATKVTDAHWYGDIWQATRNTTLLPRDLMIAAMYGRAFAVVMPDGRITWAMSAVSDVSKSLDVLGSTVGSILVRGVDWWEAVPPSAQLPQWFWNATYNSRPAPPAPSAYAWKGIIVVDRETLDIKGVAAAPQWVNNATYKVAICLLNASNVIQNVWLSAAYTATDNTHRPHYWPLAVTLNVSSKYFICVGRTDSTTTYPLPLSQIANAEFQLPLNTTLWGRLATVTPTVGATVESGPTTQTIAVMALSTIP